MVCQQKNYWKKGLLSILGGSVKIKQQNYEKKI
jgi:hypothetical protein